MRCQVCLRRRGTTVEEDTQRALAGDPAVADAGHGESTQGPAVRQAGRSAALTRDDWRRAADPGAGAVPRSCSC